MAGGWDIAENMTAQIRASGTLNSNGPRSRCTDAADDLAAALRGGFTAEGWGLVGTSGNKQSDPGHQTTDPNAALVDVDLEQKDSLLPRHDILEQYGHLFPASPFDATATNNPLPMPSSFSDGVRYRSLVKRVLLAVSEDAEWLAESSEPRELAALSVACARLTVDVKRNSYRNSTTESSSFWEALPDEVDPRLLFGPFVTAASSSRWGL